MIKPNRTIQVFGTVDGCYTALTGDAGRPRPTGRPVFLSGTRQGFVAVA